MTRIAFSRRPRRYFGVPQMTELALTQYFGLW